MPIFRIKNRKLDKIKEKEIILEKDIQKLTEFNLGDIFGLECVSSEFTVNNLRIDTLCFNHENNSFIIIEYKKDKSFSVIDQGFAYLSLMLNNKAEFLLEYNEKNKSKSLTRDSVNWAQSKVIFISPFFTSHQKEAINFKNLPIELWEIKYYGDNLIEYKNIEPLETSEKIETLTGNKFIKEVTKVVKNYDLEYHLRRGSDKTRHLFSILKDKIMEFGDINEKYLQLYVSYRAGDSYISFCQVHFYKEKLFIAILIEDKKLSDLKKWIKKAPKSYGWAKNCKFFDIKSEKDIPYAMDLIRQSYEFNKNR
jgi:predicted transport protein